MKPSLSSPITEEDASVTSFIALSTACVWQGNEGMQEGFSLFVMRRRSSSSGIFFVAGGSVTGYSASQPFRSNEMHLG